MIKIILFIFTITLQFNSIANDKEKVTYNKKAYHQGNPPTGYWKIYYHTEAKHREGVITSFESKYCNNIDDFTEILYQPNDCRLLNTHDKQYSRLYSIFISDGNRYTDNCDISPKCNFSKSSWGCLAYINPEFSNALICRDSFSEVFQIAPIYDDSGYDRNQENFNFCAQSYHFRTQHGGSDYDGVVDTNEANKYNFPEPICYRLYKNMGPGSGSGSAGSTGGN